MAYTTYSQTTTTTYVASFSKVDRIELVRSSIPLTEWHEKSFWAQYNNYLGKSNDLATITYISLGELAAVDQHVDTAEAIQRAHNLIAHRRNELNVRKEYYNEIGREHNGVIALQFLQTETQLDMMEVVNIFETSAWRSFRIRPGMLQSSNVTSAKHNLLSKALKLTPEEAAVFLPLYARYEDECEQVLGENYSLYELYAGEAGDYSPGLAKRLGYELLTVLDRELELKEKYVGEFRSVAGPSLAARFLAWEDYYSVVCKMTAWVEAP